MPPDFHRWFLATAEALSPALARDIAAIGPLWFPDRPERGVIGFLARAVVGQQLSAAGARTIWARVMAAAEAGGGLAVFLDEANQAALRGCGLSGAKTRTLCGIGAAERRGDFAALSGDGVDHAARLALLTELWGVGPWTCEMLSLFHFRDTDVWPLGDLAVQRVFARYIGRRKPERAAQRFAPYRSILALYCWRLAGGAP